MAFQIWKLRHGENEEFTRSEVQKIVIQGPPTDSQDPFMGPRSQNHFHNNTKKLFALFCSHSFASSQWNFPEAMGFVVSQQMDCRSIY